MGSGIPRQWLGDRVKASWKNARAHMHETYAKLGGPMRNLVMKGLFRGYMAALLRDVPAPLRRISGAWKWLACTFRATMSRRWCCLPRRLQCRHRVLAVCHAGRLSRASFRRVPSCSCHWRPSRARPRHLPGPRSLHRTKSDPLHLPNMCSVTMTRTRPKRRLFGSASANAVNNDSLTHWLFTVAAVLSIVW